MCMRLIGRGRLGIYYYVLFLYIVMAVGGRGRYIFNFKVRVLGFFWRLGYRVWTFCFVV